MVCPLADYLSFERSIYRSKELPPTARFEEYPQGGRDRGSVSLESHYNTPFPHFRPFSHPSVVPFSSLQADPRIDYHIEEVRNKCAAKHQDGRNKINRQYDRVIPC